VTPFSRELYTLAVNRDKVSLVPFGFKFYKALYKGVDGMIPADAYVASGFELGSPLADYNISGYDGLSAEFLNPKAFTVAVTPVAAAAARFFMSHYLSPIITM
jgi:hypothetical protein